MDTDEGGRAHAALNTNGEAKRREKKAEAGAASVSRAVSLQRGYSKQRTGVSKPSTPELFKKRKDFRDLAKQDDHGGTKGYFVPPLVVLDDGDNEDGGDNENGGDNQHDGDGFGGYDDHDDDDNRARSRSPRKPRGRSP